MAQTEGSSSSDDTWFEPEDLIISTTHLLQQQTNQTQTEPPPAYEPPPPKYEPSKAPNHNENLDERNSTTHETPSTPPIQHPLTESKKQKCSDNVKPNTNTSYPHALKQAYNQLMASDEVQPPKTTNVDSNVTYDIDNLPIHLSETPMLSLQKLRNSSSLSNNTTNHRNSAKKDSKYKYSKFFVKNFFLKKEDKEEQHQYDEDDANDEEKHNVNINRIKMKGNTKDKQLNDLRLTQTIENAHKGAIYCMEFSKKGDYLATGGQDSVLRIWTICGSRADLKRWEHNTEQHNTQEGKDAAAAPYEHEYNFAHVLSVVAYREFTGHRADIIDISWSNGEFILSASIDQTVMLWHTSRTRCLCLFQHSDIVTSVTFHPNEDYLFLSGSFDSRLRLWNILEHRVVDWVQVPTLVTCTTFSVNGKFAIAGLYDGQCFFYSTQGHRLKYVTAIECRNSSGKYRKGRKVTGLQYLPSQSIQHGMSKSVTQMNKNMSMEHGSPQLLISTNDSRLRLYNLSNFAMQCKYKGHENTQSQIHARFSPDGQLIICGSEDNNIYVWRVEKAVSDESNSIFQTKKSKNRQEYYEYFKSNCKLPQVALFAPHRTIHYVYKFRSLINKNAKLMYKNNEEKIKHIILTADTEGHIHIYSNHSNEKSYKYPYDHHIHNVYNRNHSHHHHHQNTSSNSHRQNRKNRKKHK